MYKRNKKGFTLLELIIVIVLLSILGAVAFSRFLDVSSDAKTSATKAVAGALGAASANNYGIRKANSSKGSAITNCNQIGSLSAGLLPTGYTIASQAIAADAAETCTVTHSDGSTSATFTGLGIT